MTNLESKGDRVGGWWLSPGASRVLGGPIGGLVLVVIALAVYGPGLIGIGPIDRDESRFAQASRQMFESVALPEAQRDAAMHGGGLIVPYVQDRSRLNKPPLVYWLQTASAWVWTGGDPSRDAIWMARVPSVLAAVIAVLATWRLGCSMFDERAAWLGALLLAVCPMVVWDAHQGRADQVLLACTTLAVWMLWNIWRGREMLHPEQAPSASEGMENGTHDPQIADEVRPWFVPVLLWLFVALGILTKGPITPMVVALTAIGLCALTARWRWLRRTRPVLGLIVVGVLVLPWVIAAASHVGWGAYWDIIYDETIGRSASAMESHWGPPGYHTVLAAVLLWPGSLLTLIAFVRTLRLAVRFPVRAVSGSEPDGREYEKTARSRSRFISWVMSLPARWRDRVVGRDDELFLLVWIVPAWIVFELVSTKLPHYTLAMYPALALLSAKAVHDAAVGALDTAALGGIRVGFWLWLLIGLVLCCAVPIGLSLLGGGGIGFVIALLTAGGAGLVLSSAMRALNEGWIIRAQLLGALAMVVFVVGTLGFVLPRARALQVSQQLAEVLGEHPGPIAGVGYHEDSLVYLTRGRLERIAEAEAPAWKRAHRGGLLVVPFESALFDPTRPPIGEVRGFNYSRGEFVHLVITGARQ